MTWDKIVIIISLAVFVISTYMLGVYRGRDKEQGLSNKVFRAFMDCLSIDSVNEYCKTKGVDECEEIAIREFVIYLLNEVKERL